MVCSMSRSGDCWDNGIYKAELIYRRAPWRSREAVEMATLEWVSWFNYRRLLSSIGLCPIRRSRVCLL